MFIARAVAALFISLLALPAALAETRAVAIVLQRDEQDTKVTIHSDVKEERKAGVSLEEAVKIVEKMQGWRSSVMVCIVANQNPRLGLSDGVPELPELRKLLKAVEENVWLSLVYLRIGDAKGGDEMVERIIQATRGK